MDIKNEQGEVAVPAIKTEQVCSSKRNINNNRRQKIKNRDSIRKSWKQVKYTRSMFIQKRRPVRALQAMRDEWENDRKIRHAQTTGFVLSYMASNILWAANRFLPTITRFIIRNGPESVEGVWLSAMSIAKRLNPDNFIEAIDLSDDIGRKKVFQTKNDMGIYFLDFGNIAIGDAFGSNSSTVLSGFPDTWRNSLFGDNVLGRASSMNSFGMGVRESGGKSIRDLSVDSQKSLYGMTQQDCAASVLLGYASGVTVAGGIAGGIAAGVSTGGLGLIPGVALGAKEGLVFAGLTSPITVPAAYLICGAYLDEINGAPSPGVTVDPKDNNKTTTRTTTDGDTRITTTKTEDKDGNLLEKTVTEVDSTGTATTTTTDSQGSEKTDTTYNWTIGDDKVEETHHSDGSKTTVVTDKDGNTTSTHEDKAGNRTETHPDGSTTETDDAGNTTKTPPPPPPDDSEYEAGTTTEPDEEDSYPVPDDIDNGRERIKAQRKVFQGLKQINPNTVYPTPEDMGNGSSVIHYPNNWFTEQIRTAEETSSPSESLADIIERLKDITPRINPSPR